MITIVFSDTSWDRIATPSNMPPLLPMAPVSIKEICQGKFHKRLLQDDSTSLHTKIQYACQYGFDSFVQYYTNNVLQWNHVLVCASEHGNKNLVSWILFKSIDDLDVETAMFLARTHQQQDIALLLYPHIKNTHANVHHAFVGNFSYLKQNMNSILVLILYFSQACHTGNVNIVSLLLNKITPNPIHFVTACKYGHLPIVQIMLKRPQYEAAYAEGFLYACKCGHLDIVKLLVHRDENLYEGLLYAYLYKRDEIVLFLLDSIFMEEASDDIVIDIVTSAHSNTSTASTNNDSTNTSITTTTTSKSLIDTITTTLVTTATTSTNNNSITTTLTSASNDSTNIITAYTTTHQSVQDMLLQKYFNKQDLLYTLDLLNAKCVGQEWMYQFLMQNMSQVLHVSPRDLMNAIRQGPDQVIACLVHNTGISRGTWRELLIHVLFKKMSRISSNTIALVLDHVLEYCSKQDCQNLFRHYIKNTRHCFDYTIIRKLEQHVSLDKEFYCECFILACEYDSVQAIKYLLGKEKSNISEGFQRACCSGSIDVVHYLYPLLEDKVKTVVNAILSFKMDKCHELHAIVEFLLERHAEYTPHFIEMVGNAVDVNKHRLLYGYLCDLHKKKKNQLQ
jgi:hypothetical protein